MTHTAPPSCPSACSATWRSSELASRAQRSDVPFLCRSVFWPHELQCNLAFERVSLKSSGRKGGGGMGSTIGLPLSMMGGGPPGFL